MSLRDDKKARTRQALIDAGQRLFLRDGFDETSVDAIAAAAGVSRRTLFRYFESKEEVFFAPHRARLERFASLLSADAGPPGFERVREAILALAADYMRERETLIIQHRAINASRALIAHDQRLDDEWEAAIRGVLTRPPARDAPAARPPLEARLLAGAIVGMIRAALRGWFERGACDDLVAVGAAGLDALTRGFDLRACA